MVEQCGLLRQFQGRLRLVDHLNRGRAAAECGHRKAALVTEQIEHPGARCQFLHSFPGGLLVEIHPGFMAGIRPHDVLDAILLDDHPFHRLTGQHHHLFGESFELADGEVVPCQDHPRLKDSLEDLRHDRQRTIDQDRRRLHHQHIGIAIDHQAGNLIRFSVDQSLA